MARVDLKCGCGYKFFVGDAQLKAGVECPACGSPVAAPGAAPAARKGAAPKAAAKPAPAAEAAEDFDSLPQAAGRSNKKLLVIGGAVLGLIAVVTVIVIILMRPKVDYAKQAELENQARRKMFEDISSSKNSPGSPLPPASPTKAAPETKVPRSTEYKPMPPPPPPVKPPAPAPSSPQSPPTPGTPAQAVVALSPEVLGRVRAEVLTLHPFYMTLVLSPAEKARVDGLSVTAKGAAEDADFLQSILTGAKLKSVRDEISLVAQTLPTLERDSEENLPVDKISLTDGRVLNCKILEEGPEILKVSRNLASGVGGQMPVRRDSISRIEKGKGVGTEFAAQWQTVRKGTLAAMIELMMWCKANNLTAQGRLVAFTILKGDPANPQARTEAGLPADPVKHSEDVARGGVIAYQGKNWQAKELRDKFLSDGYCILEGRWYSKKEKMISVPGLFRYERQNDKPVIFGGTMPLAHETDLSYKVTHDVASGQYLEVPDLKLVRRFYSPLMTVQLTSRVPANIAMPVSTPELDVRLNVDEGTPVSGAQMTGELTIQVPVGVPILEASVITVAEVKAGGQITIYHVQGAGETMRRTKLYTCDPKESQSHVIPPDLIRGMNEVNLVAVIEQQAAYTQKVERRHVRPLVMKGKFVQSPAQDIIHHRLVPDYKAVLFPSNSNTVEVFRMKLALAEPMPHIDKLFVSNTELLK